MCAIIIGKLIYGLIYGLLSGICFLCVTIWEHPLLTTAICLILAFFVHNQPSVSMQLQLLWQRLNVVIQEKSWMPTSSCGCGFGCSFGFGCGCGLDTMKASDWKKQPTINQSPVNIDETILQRMPIRELLIWNHYNDLPTSIELENTGEMLVLRAKFKGNVPTICGADLLASYTFVEIRFHWGWCNSEGSEHTINSKKFPLEIQVLHSAGYNLGRQCTSSYDLLVIAYFFELSAHNPYLDPLVQNLKLVQVAGKKATISPFPLSYLIYKFRTGFYSYGGSLTQPPCCQGTEWFIFPETLAISEFQLRHFRQLFTSDKLKPLSRTSRPVQELGNRVICHNYYCPLATNELARLREQLESEILAQREEINQSTNVATTTSDDEGQLLESIETTTTIITNGSNTSTTCLTTLNTADSDVIAMPTQGIVIISSNVNGQNTNANNDTNNDVNSGKTDDKTKDSNTNNNTTKTLLCCHSVEKQSVVGEMAELPLPVSDVNVNSSNSSGSSSCNGNGIGGVGDGVGIGLDIGLTLGIGMGM